MANSQDQKKVNPKNKSEKPQAKSLDNPLNKVVPTEILSFDDIFAMDPKTLVDNDLIAVSPFGVSVDGDIVKPMIIFKDAKGVVVLPVPVNSLEAGVTISLSNRSSLALSPHRGTKTLLGQLGVKIEKCIFWEIKGSHQWVRLFLSGNSPIKTLDLKAEEAISLCLQLEAPIYTTLEFAKRSRILSANLEQRKRELQLQGISNQRNQWYLN